MFGMRNNLDEFVWHRAHNFTLNDVEITPPFSVNDRILFLSYNFECEVTQ